MFSKDLEVSIANLFDKANEINIQYLTVEHLFLMILNDFDVKDFGRDIIIKNDKVYVGLVNDTVEGTVGKVVQFEKDGVDIWSVHRTPTPQVDLNKFKGSFLYNTSTNDYLTSLDLIDPLQGKI